MKLSAAISVDNHDFRSNRQDAKTARYQRHEALRIILLLACLATWRLHLILWSTERRFFRLMWDASISSSSHSSDLFCVISSALRVFSWSWSFLLPNKDYDHEVTQNRKEATRIRNGDA